MLRTCFLGLAILALVGAPRPASAHHTGVQPVITDAWVRETPPGRTVTAAYLTIENRDHESDFLLAAHAKVAGLVELHTMKMDGDQMKMEKVESIEIPGGKATRLAPGGFHVMLFDLEHPLKAGETVELELEFRFAGKVTIQAVVKAPPRQP